MTRSVPRALCSLLFLSLLAACDRRLEPYVPQSEEPPAPVHPVRIPGLESPVPSASLPRALRAESGGSIRGRIVAGDGVLADPNAALFVIARGPNPGPPLAVKRLVAGPFPLAFEIGPSDVMIAGSAFAAPITLTARIDRDGNAMTRETDAASAQLGTPIAPGATDVELRLELP